MTNVKKIALQLNIILSVILLFLIIMISSAYSADYEVIFNHTDPVNDDYGPGNYQYPQNEIFQNDGNLFDIKAFTIMESEKDYLFRFSFSSLTDPWDAKYGFSLPLIELYIDNQSGGSSQLFHKGANVTFSDDFKWDKFLKISGWWVRIFNPRSEQQEILNLNEMSIEDPFRAETSVLSREEDIIRLKISKSELGLLNSSSFILLVGSFDPFGYDHFRSLNREKTLWQIYTESDLDINKLPRVMDILVPSGMSQRAILNKELAQIPHFNIERSKSSFFASDNESSDNESNQEQGKASGNEMAEKVREEAEKNREELKKERFDNQLINFLFAAYILFGAAVIYIYSR